jgi:hypothetical protein
MRVPRKAKWSETSSAVVGMADAGTLYLCDHASSHCVTLNSDVLRNWEDPRTLFSGAEKGVCSNLLCKLANSVQAAS